MSRPVDNGLQPTAKGRPIQQVWQSNGATHFFLHSHIDDRFSSEPLLKIRKADKPRND